MTSELDLERLEKVARAATDGPWSVVDGDEVASAEGPLLAGLPTGDAIVCWMPDATHIATFDPPTVLALIAEVRELRAKVGRVQEIIDGPNYAELQLDLIEEALEEEA